MQPTDAADAGRRPSTPARSTASALHVLLLVAAGGLWGVQPALIKVLADDLPEIATLGLMLACVTGVVGLTLAVRGRLFRLTRATATFMGLAGASEYALPLLITFLVADHVDAGLLTLVMSTTPVFTVTLAAATGAEALSRNSVLACLIGLMAIGLLIVPQDALPSREMVPWCLAAFSIPMCYSCGSVYVSAAWPKGMDVFQVAFGGALFSSVMLAPFWIPPLIGGELVPGSPAAAWSFLALVVAIVAEMVLYFYLVRHAGPVFTSFTSFVMIASGFVAGALLFGEQPSLWIWASVALFSLSLLLILLSRGR